MVSTSKRLLTLTLVLFMGIKLSAQSMGTQFFFSHEDNFTEFQPTQFEFLDSEIRIHDTFGTEKIPYVEKRQRDGYDWYQTQRVVDGDVYIFNMEVYDDQVAWLLDENHRSSEMYRKIADGDQNGLVYLYYDRD